MNASAKWKQAILRLRQAKDAKSQLAELKLCFGLSIVDPFALKQYHDAVLFLCAYPRHEKVYLLALQGLQRLAKILQHHQNNRAWKYKLSGTGLPFTELRCQYSVALTTWLLQKFPGDIEAAEADNDILPLLLQATLPGIEFYDVTQGNLNTWNRIKLLSGHYRNRSAINWVLQLFQQQHWDPVLKDLLYDKLKIFLSWKLNDKFYNQSFLSLSVSAIYCRRRSGKKLNSRLFIRLPLTIQSSLPKEKKEELIAMARVSLALYYRETDPFSFADASETSLFDMGGGVQIALLGMIKERRLSLESYIGFMAFRNGVPVAYGGGWIFGYRCKIGINIYPPFRGGESAELFLQVLRLYLKEYKVKVFVVKPYQFGKGNSEGLRSGAFWFYYKLGFRPTDEAIKKIAEAEYKNIEGNKSYRTPRPLLKSFTGSNMEWKLEKRQFEVYDAEKISVAVTNMIRDRFAADREEATKTCLRELSCLPGFKKSFPMLMFEKSIWANWSLLFACLPNEKNWNKMERKQFLQLIKLKIAGKEKDFILALQHHKAFWSSVKKLLHCLP